MTVTLVDIRLIQDAERYRWLREQVRYEEDTVEVQGFFWGTSKPREFDEWVDEAMADESAKRAPVAEQPVPDVRQT